MDHLIYILHQKNKKELQQIYYKMTNNHINKSKINIINQLVKPLRNTYKMGERGNISLEYIYNDLMNNNREICGKQEDGKFYLLSEGPLPPAKSSCQLDKNYPIIWHTHPVSSKFYPSIQDILKVIKHSTQISYIFTSQIIWIITCSNKWGTTPSFQKNGSVYNTLESINNNLYRKSQYNARILPENNNIIEEYIYELNGALVEFGWNIRFSNWN
jgi:hypothetical protein